MHTVRIHVDAPLAEGTSLLLPAAQATHVARALRMRPGDRVNLFNGDGCEYVAAIETVHQREIRINVESVRACVRESPLRITLAQALARGEKMDWIVQKGTELGVACIVPLVTERSEVHLEATRADRRGTHWRAIAIAAAEQCGRNRLPDIAAPVRIGTWLAGAQAPAHATTRLMLQPEGGVTLRALGTPSAAMTVAIGPEGGFGASDLAALRQAGFTALTLGPRILRTETAGIVALAALQALYGDL